MNLYCYNLEFFKDYAPSNPLYCFHCGKTLRNDEGYNRKDGKPYCKHCTKIADLQMLIRIFELNTDDLYRPFGLVYTYANSEHI